MEASFAATCQLQDVAGLVLDDDRRLQVRTARRRTPVDNLTLGDAGGLRRSFPEPRYRRPIFEIDTTFDFRHHRTCVGIPLGETLAALNLVAIIDKDASNRRQRAARSVPRRVVMRMMIAMLRPIDDENAIGVAQHVAVLDLDRTFVRCFQERLVDHVRRTTKVERTHGQLRARLTDRLSRDNADRFAHVDRRTTGQIAAVADAADAGTGFRRSAPSGCGSTGCQPSRFRRHRLVDHRRRHRRALTRDRMIDIVERRTAKKRGRWKQRPDRHQRSAVMVRPFSVPQSTELTMQSCATSTRRRVR